VLIIPVIIGILLIYLAYLFFEYERKMAEDHKYAELRSIARLKSTQISNWYNERLRDIRFFSSSASIKDEVKFFEQTGRFNKKNVLKFLNPVISGNFYNEIILVTPDGRMLFSIGNNYKPDSIINSDIVIALKTRELSAGNLNYCKVHHVIHDDIIAPVFNKDSISAILIFRSDPHKFLYPYLQEWPIPSKSAESILVGRIGDSAVYLNEMKKFSNYKLQYKSPLSDTLVAAVQAALGGTGKFIGQDYNGNKILSDLRRIEGLPWFLVAKIDYSELYTEFLSKSLMFLLMVIMITGVVTGGLVFGYRKRELIVQKIKEQRDLERFAEELKVQVDKRTQDLQRSNEELLRFAHIISHDLKEPVRKIRFLISLISLESDKKVLENIGPYISKIEMSSKRLNSLIENLGKYSESQNPELEFRCVDLNRILNNVIVDLELLAEEKQTTFSIKPLPEIEGIPVLLYHMFYNLLNNAIKFAKKDVPLIVHVSSTVINIDGRDFIEINICDNGIGFPDEYSERIFKFFNRLHSKDRYEGTGLGLALSKKIAERHDGDITATGQENEGATFRVKLPVKHIIHG